MADNYQTESVGTPGVTFKSDEDGSTIHWPYVKLAFGPDNTQTRVGSISSNPLPVALSDTDNAVLDSIQTAVEVIDNTVYSEDDVTPATIVGNAIVMERDDALSALTPIEGDWVGLRGSAEGALWVQDFNSDAILADTNTIAGDTTSIDSKITACDTGAVVISSGTVTANLGATDNAVLDSIAANTANLNNCIIQDDAPFTPASGFLMMVGGEHDDAAPDSVDEGDAGNFRISANRSLYVQLRDSAGNERGLNVDVNGDIGVTNAHLTSLGGAIDGTEVQVDVVGALPAGNNAIGKLAANSGVDIGDVDVLSIAAGSNLVGDVGLSGARTSGGTTPYKNLDVDETEDEVKGTAGQVYWIHAMNLSASKLYLKFYNATAASVVVGTTTPVLTFPIGTQGDTNGFGFTLAIPNGIQFDTAITVAATTGVADNDTGAPGANELVLNLGYA